MTVGDGEGDGEGDGDGVGRGFSFIYSRVELSILTDWARVTMR